MFEIFKKVPETIVESELSKRQRRKYVKSIERTAHIMAYLGDREGQETTLAQIAEAVGTTQSQVSRLMSKLISNGTITRQGTLQHYTYTVNGNLPKEPVTQVPEEQPTSPQTSAKDRILSFLRSHEDRLITQAEIARGSGTAQSKVSKLIQELEAEGRVVRSAPTYEGTRYWVAQSPNLDEPVTENPSGSNEPNTPVLGEAQLLSVINELVWAFVRSTRTTDVLAFLTWLESQRGQGAVPDNKRQ